ncbi:hypothetical protein COOONC_14264, partial [Cooperia oncophora]
ENYTSDFEKKTAEEVINYTPYEYGSIMHYGSQFRAKNGGDSGTMSVINAEYKWTIGSFVLSFYDIMMVNSHYHCKGIFNCKDKA